MSYQIPFDKDGNHMHYPENWRNPVWKDNYEWEDVIEYQTYSRGRSAANIIFRSALSKKREYTVFLTDFSDMVPFMVRGVVSGTFTFVKRGQNYGVKRVK